jgi:hypothetical protein
MLHEGAADRLEADVELEAEATAQTHCHPRLSCARETSASMSMLDEHGLAGLVCSHGQPLRGGFLAMDRPERFYYYDHLLADVLERSSINIFYLDTGCTYGRHWEHTFPEEAPRPTHIRVPLWHAQAHGPDCFTVNSGMYLPGECLMPAKQMAARSSSSSGSSSSGSSSGSSSSMCQEGWRLER